MGPARRPYVIAGVGTAAAGLIAVAPAPPPVVDVRDIALTSSAADIVIDIVRHGQRLPPFDLQTTSSPPYPGPPLSDLGQQQAHEVGTQLFNELGGPNGVAGVFSGQSIRDLQTAAPFAALEHMTSAIQTLPGLDEVDPGIYGSLPQLSPGSLMYVGTSLLWAAGLELVPMPGSADFNGVVFDDKFTAAIDAMYNAAMANPVVSANGQITDVAFNNEESIVAWVLMNVKNPDLLVLLSTLIHSLSSPAPGFLPNAGVVQIAGNPDVGWTLVSWDGTPVPQDPGLVTELFLDFRNLITAPQIASWNTFEALLSGDPTAIVNSLAAGVGEVGRATIQFPVSVITDILGAVSGATHGLAADVAGSVPGGLGAADAATLFDPAGISSLLGTLAADLPAMLPNLIP